MNSVTQRETMFPARLSSVREVREFLESFCRESGIGRPPSLRLNLVVEELFTNTVTHGHGGDSDSPVWIKLAANNTTVTLTYLDKAPAFNPFGILLRPSLEGSIEQRKVGGLGVLLANELTAAAEYAYLFGRNRLRMALMR
ncbi:MAG: ATP-binding protein [Betaproteobacteria bacterium]